MLLCALSISYSQQLEMLLFFYSVCKSNLTCGIFAECALDLRKALSRSNAQGAHLCCKLSPFSVFIENKDFSSGTIL